MGKRIYKFRAWDKKYKTMLHEGDKGLQYYALTFDGKIVTANDTDLVYADGIDLELMQFTGLLDKNSVEIYESDIVYLAGYGDYEVKWPFRELFDAAAENDIGEIKCNIYQNRELLKEQ